MDGVATTALLVAAIRAREQQRPDRLFDDPFADALAGPAGHAALDAYRAAAGPGRPIIEVRTHYYDAALARAMDEGIRQVVFLAAGMDARAYRLAWPAGTRVYELDQPEVLAHKARVLADATPTCSRLALAVDLREDWPVTLEAAGFDRRARTAWMIEGLLQYLPPDSVGALLARVDALSSRGSRAHLDLAGEVMLGSPMLAAAKEWMASIGAPWTFGTDDPGGLFPAWDVTSTDPAALGNTLGRWPFAAAPPNVRGIPRSYLVTATKR